jgi:hypothetical protein
MVPDQWGRLIELTVQIFCDDGHYSSSGSRARQGLEERFRIAALFCAFIGMEHRPDKCNAALGLWSGEAAADKRRYMRVEEQKEAGVRVRIRDEHEKVSEEVTLLDPYASTRALGVQQRYLLANLLVFISNPHSHPRLFLLLYPHVPALVCRCLS